MIGCGRRTSMSLNRSLLRDDPESRKNASTSLRLTFR